MVIIGPGLRAYRSWKEFANLIATAVIKEQARLIRTEHIAGLDDHKVTVPKIEPYVDET